MLKRCTNVYATLFTTLHQCLYDAMYNIASMFIWCYVQHCTSVYMMLCTTFASVYMMLCTTLCQYYAMYNIAPMFIWCYIWHCTSVYMMLCMTLHLVFIWCYVQHCARVYMILWHGIIVYTMLFQHCVPAGCSNILLVLYDYCNENESWYEFSV